MFYLKKAGENVEAAECDLKRGRYNAAASRFYYSLYLRGKDLLIRRGFDYELFLRNGLRIRDWKHKRHLYSHGTICRALTGCLFVGDNEIHRQLAGDFFDDWKFLFKLRVRADYLNEDISENKIEDCRKRFYKLKEIIENG